MIYLLIFACYYFYMSTQTIIVDTYKGGDLIKIRDRILLGVITGIAAGIPGRLLNAWEYNKGITDEKYGQMASSLFLPKGRKNSTEAKVIGSLTNHINISITGIIVTYLLSATGRDKAVLKGLGVSSTAWLAIYGLASRLGITSKSKKPIAPLLSFFDHATLGVLCALIASRLGDDSLFPDKNNLKADEKMPLISSSSEVSLKKKKPANERTDLRNSSY